VIASRGNVSGIQRQVQAQIAKQSQSPFTCAVFGKNSVSVSGNGKTDSYNSNQGAYGSLNVGSNGDIGTNGVVAGAITLSGNAKVYGDTATGPGGTVVIGGNAAVYGATTHDSTKSLPSVVVPTTLTSLASGGAYSASSNQTMTISGGAYRYSSLSISGNATVTVSGNVEIYLTDSTSLSVTGNGQLIIASGAQFTIYSAGKCNLAGNGVLNQTNRPKNLLFYSTYTGSNGISVSGNNSIQASIYAPDTDISNSGNGSIYGSAIGKTVTLSGNGDLHYDEALTDVSAGFFPCTYTIQSWREQ